MDMVSAGLGLIAAGLGAIVVGTHRVFPNDEVDEKRLLGYRQAKAEGRMPSHEEQLTVADKVVRRFGLAVSCIGLILIVVGLLSS